MTVADIITDHPFFQRPKLGKFLPVGCYQCEQPRYTHERDARDAPHEFNPGCGCAKCSHLRGRRVRLPGNEGASH